MAHILPKLHRRLADAFLPRIRGSRILPRRPLRAFEMVHPQGARTSNSPALLREHHQQCVWLAPRVWRAGWDGWKARKGGLAVRVCL